MVSVVKKPDPINVVERREPGWKLRECSTCHRLPTHYFKPRNPRRHTIVCPSCWTVVEDTSGLVAVAEWNRRQRGEKK